MSINAVSLAAARDLNDVLARLGWYGWYAYPTDTPHSITLQYKREDGTSRAVDCETRGLMRYIKAHPRRCDVAAVCDKKPARQGAAVQQELNFSELPAIGRAALNPNKHQH